MSCTQHGPGCDGLHPIPWYDRERAKRLREQREMRQQARDLSRPAGGPALICVIVALCGALWIAAQLG